MFFFKHVFFWLSGAGSEALERCPNWEQRKYVAFGATVLVPCAFAFIACAYALSTITDDPKVIYPVAGVWAFIILTIDRALLAGYRPYLSIFRKLRSFVRVLIMIRQKSVNVSNRLKPDSPPTASAGTNPFKRSLSFRKIKMRDRQSRV